MNVADSTGELIGLVKTVIEKVDKVGDIAAENGKNTARLEERIAGFMGLAETIQQSNSDKIQNHENRLHALEDWRRAKSEEKGNQDARNKFTDNVLVRILLPVAGFVLAGIYLDYRSSRGPTVTSAPTINVNP